MTKFYSYSVLLLGELYSNFYIFIKGRGPIFIISNTKGSNFIGISDSQRISRRCFDRQALAQGLLGLGVFGFGAVVALGARRPFWVFCGFKYARFWFLNGIARRSRP